MASTTTSAPCISIVTPVYNGGRYLAEAIESVLSQSYRDWEYIIVDNRSSDDTLKVALRYAALDARIRVVTNDVFVDCEANHNIAFRQISPRSKYCKVISADDWLMPQALAKFVSLAECHPSAGIVGSYQESKGTVKWKGLPPDVDLLPGREACRLHLLEGVHVFGNPMSVLYRSDLVRRADPFLPHERPHADTSACFAQLHDCDFGFVHEVLSVERIHEGQVSWRAKHLLANSLAAVETIDQYGPMYINKVELERRRGELMEAYYGELARAALTFKGPHFWRYQRTELKRLGYPLDRPRIARQILFKLARLASPSVVLRRLAALRGARESGVFGVRGGTCSERGESPVLTDARLPASQAEKANGLSDDCSENGSAAQQQRQCGQV